MSDPIHDPGRPIPGPRIVPIVIGTPFAVGDVYSYLIYDEKIVLVDCGHKSDASFERMKYVLGEQGVGIADIDEIWLTHGHPDHFGQAALLADRSGAAVWAHPKERSNLAGNSDRDRFREFFSDHRLPSPIIARMLDQLEWLQQYQQPIVPQWVEDGDVLESGALRFGVKHLPGHAPGHVAFYQISGAAEGENILFGGDVLLEHISTNALINFDPQTGQRNRSLLQYRQSLRWMKVQEGMVLPGHGERIPDIRAVAEHHLREQQERYAKIKSLLAAAPHDLLQLSHTLFPDALKEGMHFLVFSEIIGYLDWGMSRGDIELDEAGGMVYHVAR